MSQILGIIVVCGLSLLRKALGHSDYVDAIVPVLLLSGFCVLPNKNKRLSEFGPLGDKLVVSLLIPGVLVGLTQLGYGFVRDGMVHFYGLHVVDFGNLSAITALVKIGGIVPNGPVNGDSALQYHWFFFAFPAWASQFAAGEIPADRALALANAVVGAIALSSLFACAKCVSHSGCEGTSRGDRASVLSSCLVVGAVMFLPSIKYLSDYVIRLADLGVLVDGARNHLALTPINSMAVFGNNTLACASAIVGVCLSKYLDSNKHWFYYGAASLFASLTLLLSVTIFLPLAFGLCVWFAVNRPSVKWRHLCALALPPIFTILVARQLGMFGTGGSAKAIAFGFDGFRWLRTLAFAFAPVVAAFMLVPIRRMGSDPAFYVVSAVLIVPTLLYMGGSPTGGADFSMKAGTLFCFLAVFAWREAWSRLEETRFVARAMVQFTLLAAFVNAVAYVGQFPAARVGLITSRLQSMPLEKHHCLSHTRSHTENNAVVVNCTIPSFLDANETTVIAERVSGYLSQYNAKSRMLKYHEPERWVVYKGQYVLCTSQTRVPAASTTLCQYGDYIVLQLDEDCTLENARVIVERKK